MYKFTVLKRIAIRDVVFISAISSVVFVLFSQIRILKYQIIFSHQEILPSCIVSISFRFSLIAKQTLKNTAK